MVPLYPQPRATPPQLIKHDLILECQFLESSSLNPDDILMMGIQGRDGY